MINKEEVAYAYSPQEAARRFLKALFPSYRPRPGIRSANPPYNVNFIANLTWHNIKNGKTTLRETPIAFAVLVVADLDLGLSPEDEREALHESAAREYGKLIEEVGLFETMGEWRYGNLDSLRDPQTKDPKSDAEYLEEKRDEIQKLKALQWDLMETVRPSSPGGNER